MDAAPLDLRPPGRLPYFLGILVPVLALCVVALASVLFTDYSRLTSDARNEQIRLINLIAASVQNALDTLNNQTASLSREGYLRDFLDNPDTGSAALAERFHTVAANAPIIYRMQLLDGQGKEILQVETTDGRTSITPDTQLGDRAPDAFFIEAMQLPEGESYVSPLFLNARDGNILEPEQPLSIYAMPVFNSDGERRGVFAVWVHAGVLLQSIHNYDNRSGSQLWVVNREGHWLVAPDNTALWGHVLPDRASRSLVHQQPELWRRIVEDESVSFRYEGALVSRIPVCSDMSCRITYNAVDATEARVPLNLSPTAWHIIAYLPATELAWTRVLLEQSEGWLPLALMLVLITLLSAGVAWRHATAITAVLQHEIRLGQLNHELQSEKQNLERRVSERTEQLRRAIDVAESANRAKSAFLAAMSHEIRTPMYGVIGSIDVLRQSSLRPRQLEQAGLIRESALNLLAIIDDILDFSKIEADKIQLEEEPVQLAYVTDSACNAVVPVAEKKRVTLRVYRTSAVPAMVRSDAVRLRQIITNLLGNAIKFSADPSGTGRVEAVFDFVPGENADAIGPGDYPKGMLLVRVTDNGIGMDAETMGMIFEPFAQADLSTTRRFGGTGLGLTITRRLVDLMQGSIEVSSTPGNGATFTVQLPLIPEDDRRPSEPIVLQDVHVFLVVADPLEISAWLDWLRYYQASAEVIPLDQLQSAMKSRSKPRQIVIFSTPEIDEVSDELLQALEPAEHVVVLKQLDDRKAFVCGRLACLDSNASINDTIGRFIDLLTGRLALNDEEEVPPHAAATVDREQARLNGRLILVAEDNEVNQDVIRDQLEVLGYACDIASNGGDALQLWQLNKDQYALVLTDLHMPGMDGYELTAAIRAQDQDRRLPVLAFTANATKGERATCLACGMDDYLTKPLALDTLRTKLLQWLAPLPEALHPHSDAKVFDTTRLAEISSDPLRSTQLLKKFCKLAAESKRDLRKAPVTDHVAIAAIAHKLKSSSRAVGALALGEACAELEEQAKAKSTSINPAIAAFHQVLEDTLLSIKASFEETPEQ